MQVHGTFNPSSVVASLLLLAIWVGMAIYALNDLYQPNRRVQGFTKDVWAIIILLIGIVGAVFYLLYGRDNS